MIKMGNFLCIILECIINGIINVVMFRINLVFIIFEFRLLFNVRFGLFFYVVRVDIIIFGVEVLKFMMIMSISKLGILK